MERTNPAVNRPWASSPVVPPRRLSLAGEITAALIVKLLFIGALWFLFFSKPVDEHLDDAGIAAAFTGVRAGSELKPPQGHEI